MSLHVHVQGMTAGAAGTHQETNARFGMHRDTEPSLTHSHTTHTQIFLERMRSRLELALAGFALPRLITSFELECDEVVNAAGHAAVPIARAIAGTPAEHVPPQFFAKGSYFGLSGVPAVAAS